MESTTTYLTYVLYGTPMIILLIPRVVLIYFLTRSFSFLGVYKAGVVIDDFPGIAFLVKHSQMEFLYFLFYLHRMHYTNFRVQVGNLVRHGWIRSVSILCLIKCLFHVFC